MQPFASPVPCSFQNTKIHNVVCQWWVCIAAATAAILRIANNKHYSSDYGAGIGLLSGILVTNYNPFQAIKFGRKK
jgi:hypothetical protein